MNQENHQTSLRRKEKLLGTHIVCLEISDGHIAFSVYGRIISYLRPVMQKYKYCGMAGVHGSQPNSSNTCVHNYKTIRKEV